MCDPFGVTLKQDITAKRAYEDLRALRFSLDSSPTVPMQDWYVGLINALELSLGNVFEHDFVLDLLHTARYQTIVAADNPSPRDGKINNMVSAEWMALRTRIERVRNQYFELTRLLADTRPIALVDTNVLIHCVPLSEFDWAVLLGTKETVRVMLVPAVVEEVDRKAHEGGPHVIKRARRAAATLRTLLGDADVRKPVEFTAKHGQGATLEIPPDDLGRTRLADADDELIDFGRFLRQAAGGTLPVALLTRDVMLQVRARGAGLTVTLVPDGYLKPDEQAKAS